MNAFPLMPNPQASIRAPRSTTRLKDGNITSITSSTSLLQHVPPKCVDSGLYRGLLPLCTVQKARKQRPCTSSWTKGPLLHWASISRIMFCLTYLLILLCYPTWLWTCPSDHTCLHDKSRYMPNNEGVRRRSLKCWVLSPSLRLCCMVWDLPQIQSSGSLLSSDHYQSAGDTSSYERFGRNQR
jgi:hypothetical protein